MTQIAQLKKNIAQWFNGIDTNLKFKLTVENNSCISFLDLNIQRKPDKIELGVYRKEANICKTIHNNSNHPQQHKIAAYRFYINRLTTLPITKKEKEKEWNVILNAAHNNGFSTEDINKLKQRILTQQSKKFQECTNGQTSKKVWATFTYYGWYIRGITKLFRNSQVQIAYRTINTTFEILTHSKQNAIPSSGIYKLTCNTCQGVYIGQTGRSTDARYKGHIRYIRTNNP